MTQKNIQEIRRQAKMHLRKARCLAEQSSSPLRGLSKEQVMGVLRPTREQLWAEKIASSSRRQ